MLVSILNHGGGDTIIQTIREGSVQLGNPVSFTLIDSCFRTHFNSFNHHIRWLVDFGEMVEHGRPFSSFSKVGTVQGESSTDGMEGAPDIFQAAVWVFACY